MSCLLTIAFGAEYDKIAAAAMRYSRQFTDLPIYVLTNIPRDKRSEQWEELERVCFIECLDYHDKENRYLKLRLNSIAITMQIVHRCSKFLYLDADSVIQKPGIEKIFDYLNRADIVLNQLDQWKAGKEIPRIYAKAFKMADVHLPIQIFNGGFFAFKATQHIHRLFEQWRRYWILFGAGREMPALNCAIYHHSGLRICNVGKQDVFAPGEKNPDAIIQHQGYNAWFDDFNLPRFQENKWFDSDPTDFHMVTYE